MNYANITYAVAAIISLVMFVYMVKTDIKGGEYGDKYRVGGVPGILLMSISVFGLIAYPAYLARNKEISDIKHRIEICDMVVEATNRSSKKYRVEQGVGTYYGDSVIKTQDGLKLIGDNLDILFSDNYRVIKQHD